ncbi:MAG: two-component system, cell cycle sensor histidine kinase and response regulator CckA [Thermoanaerobaculia bacterium]|jgi:DNA-binding response OmpR family regulator|nr:two-component system, cell cycle sensor histidine kinase and response regulator CckA [Thermoanaerobaculia bacterium]
MSATQDRSTPHVLIVDDDEGIQALMKALLLRRDVVVDSATDGDVALRKLRERSYDSIVLDLMLPKVNGFEVVRDLKNRTPELLKRTIVVTAVSNLMLRDFKDSELVRRVMRKPFDINEFIDEVLACAAENSH